MNLILVEEHELGPADEVLLEGRRAQHLAQVLKAEPGDRFRVGRLHGSVGEGELLRWEGAARETAVLRVQLSHPPPPRPGIDLLLAVPRPKALKRILTTAATLGIGRLVLVNAARTDKAYFQSDALAPSTVDRLFREGLEQGRDTVPPELRIEPRFRPFVEDALPVLWDRGVTKLLAHPSEDAGLAATRLEPGPRLVLAVGPDGGWVPFELELLQAQGFLPLSLGERVLRVETAVPYLVGWLAALRGRF